MTVSDASGFEDTAIAIDLAVAVTDDSETIDSIVIAGVPEGASLSAGTDNGDGSWTLTEADLPGLTVTPAHNSSDDFTLTYTVTTRDGDSTRDTTGTFRVTVISTPEAAELKAAQVDPDDPWADTTELAILNAQAEVDELVDLADDALMPALVDEAPDRFIEPLVDGEPVDASEIVARIDEPTAAPAADPDIDPDFNRPSFEVILTSDDSATRRAGAEDTTDSGTRDPFGDRGPDAGGSGTVEGDTARSGVFPVLWGMLRGLGIGPRTEQRDEESRANRRRG